MDLIHRKMLAVTPAADREAVRERLIADHEAESGGVRGALALGVIDAVIEPARTRRQLAEALLAARPVRGRHGDIPL
ncbi:hypothetical protein ACQEUX_03525 [Micromonospora sp. CA-259024]|uniref:hypothetical protein n=1 Tax=Micromonospora sp. CA-259024 TaxID=3239965 RepID=UPI003D932CED